MGYILFDIGGTKMRVAYTESDSKFETPQVVATPTDYGEGLKAFIQLIKDCAKGRPIGAISGGIAGPFDEKKRSLVGSPNLKDWIGKPLKNDLQEAFGGVPVFIENDSAMVGLGEANFGAGRGFGIVAYITVSTGVGGVRIVSQKIDEKSVGFEPGHQIIDADKTLVPEVAGIHLGYILSGKGVETRMGRKPKEITDPNFWDQMSKYLAYALNNVAVFWSPDCIVLGGSMITGDPAIPIDQTEKYLKEILKIFPEIPVIKKAELADFGGLHGALAYLKQNINL
jgi:predicted NBD/HSP70 family sugar kinase